MTEGPGEGSTDGALFAQFENKLRKWMGGPVSVENTAIYLQSANYSNDATVM